MKFVYLSLSLLSLSCVIQSAYAGDKAKKESKMGICGKSGWGQPSKKDCERMQAAQKELDRRDLVAQAQRCGQAGPGSAECRGPGVAEEAARQRHERAAVAASLTPMSQVQKSGDAKKSKSRDNGHGTDAWGHSYGSQSGKR